MIGGSEAGRIRMEGSQKVRKRGLDGVHAEGMGRMWSIRQRLGKEWRMVKQEKEKNGEWLCSEEQKNEG